MGRGSIIGVVLLTLALTLVSSGAASAAAPEPLEEPSPPAAFTLGGTHGFKILGSVFSTAEGRRGMVSLAVRRRDESVSYVAPAKVTPDSIRADLGSLGRIDLTLRRSGVEKTIRVKCLHHSETYEVAAYVGVVEFNGEGGYTHARATKVPALPFLRLLGGSACRSDKSFGESRGPGIPGARLAATSFADGRVLKPQMNKNRPAGKALFSASVRERRDGIGIYRNSPGWLRRARSATPRTCGPPRSRHRPRSWDPRS